MTFSRTLRRLAAYAAAFGIALQALWPAIAQAAPKDSISVPVCSVGGVQHEIELPLGKTNDGTQHCKLCVLGTDKPAVSNSTLALFSFTGKAEGIQERKAVSLNRLAVLTAHSRAPPVAA